MGAYRYYYSLLYNGFSLLSLIPLVVVTHNLVGPPLIVWHGGYQFFRGALLLFACWLFWDGSRHYAFDIFLGLSQVREKKQAVSLTSGGGFCQDGALGLCRHPWYLGSLIVIWTLLPWHSVVTLLIAAVLTIYLVVGAMLEERRLVAEYGEKYRQYQREVSMLMPVQWIYRWLRKRYSMK